jgi:hypothetical protein
MVMRDDVVGMDTAGQELFTFDEQGAQRFKIMYLALVQAAIKKGEVLVFRPHVGEGAINPETGKPWSAEDRIERPDGRPIHYDRAKKNIDTMLTMLEELQAQGLLDTKRIVIRFGHATHTTPEQAQRMAALGVIAEANPGSNLATRVVDPVDGPKGDKTKRSETEQLADHSLLTLLFYKVTTILSTDGHSVENTSMGEEYSRAYKMIEDFLAGKTKVRVTKETAGVDAAGNPKRGTLNADGSVDLSVHDLTDAELQIFLDGYQALHKHAEKYLKGRRGGAEIDEKGDLKPDPEDRPTANAAPVADERSTFDGQLDAGKQEITQADAQKTIDGPMPFLPEGAKRAKGSNKVVLQHPTDKNQTMEVEIVVGDVAPIQVKRGDNAQVMVPAAQYDRAAAKKPGEVVKVTIARGATAEDIARALSHELHELQAMLAERPAPGTQQVETQDDAEAEKEALARQHAAGRVGELKVLFARLVPNSSGAGLDSEVARQLVIEVEGVLAELGLSRQSSHDELEARLGPTLALQVSKLNFLADPDYKSKGQDTPGGEVRIYGQESRMGSKPSPGHVMGTTTQGDEEVHSSFAPAPLGTGPTVPIGDRVEPFEGAGSQQSAVKPGEFRKDSTKDKYVNGKYDFDHRFSADFLPTNEFALAVQLIETIAATGRDTAYQLMTIDADPKQKEVAGRPVITTEGEEDRATVQARNCVTDLVLKLLRTETHFETPDGKRVMVLDEQDMAMLNLNADGTAKRGADLKCQDLYHHLRWKEAQILGNPEKFKNVGDRQPKKSEHLFEAENLKLITPNQVGTSTFGGPDFMDWGTGPEQCDKRIEDLKDDANLQALIDKGVTLEMAELWAAYYDFEKEANPRREENGRMIGNPSAAPRAKLMHFLAERLRRRKAEAAKKKRDED